MKLLKTERVKMKNIDKDIQHMMLSLKKYDMLLESSKPIVEKKDGKSATNPYAIGMSAAMKSTGDTPPLKKSTIVKGHEIAKKIETDESEENQPDQEVMEWVQRFARVASGYKLSEATGDKSFDDMMGRLTGGAAGIPDDSSKFDSMMKDVTDFEKTPTGVHGEYNALVSQLERLIPIGNKIIDFIINYRRNFVGPDRIRKDVPDQYYALAQSYVNGGPRGLVLTHYLTNWYYKNKPVPPDLKNIDYTMEDWFIEELGKIGISTRDFYAVQRALRDTASGYFEIEGAGFTLGSGYFEDFFWLWESGGEAEMINEYRPAWDNFTKWVNGCKTGYVPLEDIEYAVEEIFFNL